MFTFSKFSIALSVSSNGSKEIKPSLEKLFLAVFDSPLDHRACFSLMNLIQPILIVFKVLVVL